MNTLKLSLLMGTLTILLVLLGNAVGGTSGAVLFFIISMGMNFFSYYFSDKMVIKMTGSYPVTEEEAPELYALVKRLTEQAKLPMPRLYITPSPQPNAFATGRNPANSAVAVTEGLLNLLNKTELEGVLAHELAHIKNRDVLIGTIAAAFAGAISMIANVVQWGAMFGGLSNDDEEESGAGLLGSIILAIVAPIAAMIIQMAISRSREYLADETGARIAGNTSGLANALLKMDQAAQHVPVQISPATSHLFIVNPLAGQSLASLFSTHPPISERVRKLKELRI
ncbi:MAG: zinc metalloprotease HtpX [Firmicutes bacterium]|nr:zinc metalloprotease HtpX [Bacillota bacterium]